MIGKLNHIAIVVPDLAAAANLYKETLGGRVSNPVDMPEHGVTTVFVELDNSKVELLHPLGEDSAVQNFLNNNPGGGMHHVCYEVPDIDAAIKQMVDKGARVLGGGKSKIGAHGLPVVFLHPKDFCGTLVELEEIGEPQISYTMM